LAEKACPRRMVSLVGELGAVHQCRLGECPYAVR
jgi:hypothetical protein